MQPIPTPVSNSEPTRYSINNLESMMTIADPVCLGSIELDISVEELFDVAYEAKHKQFLTQLALRCRQDCVSVQISPWHDISITTSQISQHITEFKCRMVSVVKKASTWTWISPKRYAVSSAQYYARKKNGWVLYTLSESSERKSIRAIEKFQVKRVITENAQTEKSHVTAWSSAHHSSGLPPNLFLFNKTVNCCRLKFHKWRELMEHRLTSPLIGSHTTIPVEKKEPNVADDALSQFEGSWTKMNSSHSITMNETGLITYDDDSTFQATIVSHSPYSTVIRAQYTNGAFDGTLVKGANRILWSNESIWLKQGFESFSGTYHMDDLVVIFHPDGTLEYPNNHTIRVILESENTIVYRDTGVKYTAKLDGETLRWQSGAVWYRGNVENTDNKQLQELQVSQVSSNEEEHLERKSQEVLPDEKSEEFSSDQKSIEHEASLLKDEEESLDTTCSFLDLEYSENRNPSNTYEFSQSFSGERLFGPNSDYQEEVDGWLVIGE